MPKVDILWTLFPAPIKRFFEPSPEAEDEAVEEVVDGHKSHFARLAFQ